jgi:RND family efflux transporter MFP subunit
MQNSTSIIFLAILFTITSCGFNASTQQEVKPIPVEVLEISEHKQVNTHTYVGRIEESASIPLSAPSGGLVTNVYVANGDRVKAGQILFTIDSVQAYNSLQIAQATLQQAQDGYQRAKQVFDQQGVTEQKMVELNSQLQQAQSMLAIASKRLEDCTITAPRDGIIGECNVQVGQHITPATPIITLLDLQGYNVTFDVSEKDISIIQIGDKGSISIEAINLSNAPIKITDKNLIANRLSHTYTITAALIQPTKQLLNQLLPGMVSKVQLQTNVIEGIVLPANYIHTQTHNTMVWVVENGKAVRREVTVGSYTPTGVLITGGLTIGDKVITNGHHKMYNGANVTY